MGKKLVITLPEKLTKEWILDFYYNGDIIRHKRLSSEFFNEHKLQPIVDFLYSAFPDMSDGIEHSITEFLYRIKNNITEYPKCPVCGKEIKEWKSIKDGYNWACSHECEWSEKGRSYIFAKNNKQYENKILSCSTDEDVINFFVNKNGKVKPTLADWNYLSIRQPNIYEYLKNRFEDLKEDFNKHGVAEFVYRIQNKIETYPECPVCGKEIKEFGKGRERGYRWCCSDECAKSPKGKQIRAEMSWKDGVCGFLARDTDGKMKREKTCLERYGVEHYGILNFMREDVKAKNNSPEAQYKKYLTAKERGHLGNKSMAEEEIYEFLIKLVNDVKRQYTSEEYPFLCDYYVPSLKLYIEYNGTWQHGLDRETKRPPHPFNKNDEKDIALANRMKENGYDYALKRWTKQDVNKRETAKKNNLNYLEIFPQYTTNANYVYEIVNCLIKNGIKNINKKEVDKVYEFVSNKKNTYKQRIKFIRNSELVSYEEVK